MDIFLVTLRIVIHPQCKKFISAFYSTPIFIFTFKKMPIVVFTDGACSNNGYKDAKAGYGIHFPGEEYPDVSMPFTFGKPTNQRAELYAILQALKMTIKSDMSILIYSDSDYSIKSITSWASGWERRGWVTSSGSEVKNLDIIEPLYRLYTMNSARITFKHVRSHTGKTDPISLGNAEADRLAVEGMKSSQE